MDQRIFTTQKLKISQLCQNEYLLIVNDELEQQLFVFADLLDAFQMFIIITITFIMFIECQSFKACCRVMTFIEKSASLASTLLLLYFNFILQILALTLFSIFSHCCYVQFPLKRLSTLVMHYMNSFQSVRHEKRIYFNFCNSWHLSLAFLKMLTKDYYQW